jgi:hypothetical protein
MSALAATLPTRRPAHEPRTPHIEIVATRQQRRARPKAAYAVVTVAALFAIFAAQLLLSIVLSDGAYQLANLQSQQRELVRVEQSLAEQLAVRDSTQNLAANAAKLGMVPSASPFFLDLETGAVTAAPGTADPMGCGGSCALIGNSLLSGVPLVDPAAHAAAKAVASAPPAATTTGTATPSAEPAPAPGPSTSESLPAPVTQ